MSSVKTEGPPVAPVAAPKVKVQRKRCQFCRAYGHDKSVCRKWLIIKIATEMYSRSPSPPPLRPRPQPSNQSNVSSKKNAQSTNAQGQKKSPAHNSVAQPSTSCSKPSSSNAQSQHNAQSSAQNKNASGQTKNKVQNQPKNQNKSQSKENKNPAAAKNKKQSNVARVDKPLRLILEFTINGVPTTAIVSTGNSQCVASQSLQKLLRSQRQPYTYRHATVTPLMGRKSSYDMEIFRVPIVLQGRTFLVMFCAVRDAPERQNILGFNFVMQSGLGMDFGNHRYNLSDDKKKWYPFSTKDRELYDQIDIYAMGIDFDDDDDD